MTRFHYRHDPSARWLAAVAEGRAVLVARGSADIDELATALAAPEAAGAVLDVLTRAGLSATPPFAFVEIDTRGDARAIVRGGLAVTLDGSDGVQRVNGAGVTTWREHNSAGIGSMLIETDAATSGAEENIAAPTWPIDAGVVPTTSLRHDAAAVATVPAVEPEVADLDAPHATAVDDAEPVDEQTVVLPRPASQSRLEETIVPEHTLVPEPGGEPPADATAVITPLESVEPEASDSGYDHLFGATQVRSVESAAVRLDDEAAEADEVRQGADNGAAINSADAGDHDGLTITTAHLQELRGAAQQEQKAARDAQPAYLESNQGAREAVDRVLLIGRAPSAKQVPGGQLPRLVSVNTPSGDISRTHLRVAVEGGTVVVTDLHSRNGTVITVPGQNPVRLRGGEPTAVIAGTTIDLGGILYTVREA